MKPRKARPPTLRVLAMSLAASRGVLQAGALRLPCALGRGGVKASKREGDGATPRGVWTLSCVRYRPDRTRRPLTGLPASPLRADDGWCDAPADPNYNRPVRHPYAASAERMWREDHLYDLVVLMGYNDVPRVRGRGSAIFMHVARPGLAPTEGCIAVSKHDLAKVARVLRAGARVRIG